MFGAQGRHYVKVIQENERPLRSATDITSCPLSARSRHTIHRLRPVRCAIINLRAISPAAVSVVKTPTTFFPTTSINSHFRAPICRPSNGFFGVLRMRIIDGVISTRTLSYHFHRARNSVSTQSGANMITRIAATVPINATKIAALIAIKNFSRFPIRSSAWDCSTETISGAS